VVSSCFRYSGARLGGWSRGGGGAPPAGHPPADPPPPGAGADPYTVARTIALRQLTTAARTRSELASAMTRRGVTSDVAEKLLTRLEELQLIDDEALAKQWVQSRHAGRGVGRRVLAQELRRRGVDAATVREAVEEIGPEQELAAARDLARRRLAGMSDTDPARRMRRLIGILARKGYASNVVMQVARESRGEALDPVWEDGPDGLDDDLDGGLPG
jgi:regulatory protein